jgi:hypothetical protein
MYRQNAPPPPPDPREAARQATKNCAQMQVGVAILHVISFALLLLQFSFYKPPPQFQVPIEIVQEWRLTALLAGVSYVLVFGTWGILNAWGLGKRSRAARWSSIAFAAATMATCCAWPFGGFLLYMLLRRDVKSYFDEPAPPPAASP